MAQKHGAVWSWVGGISGVAYVMLFLADVVLTPGEPDPGAPTDQIATYYAGHRSAILMTSLLHDLSGIAFIVFLAALFVSLWQSDSRRPELPLLSLVGALVAAPVAYASYVAAGAAAYLADRTDPALIAALAELRYVASGVAVLPLSVFLAGASLTIVLGRTVPRWIGWLGLVSAAANVVSILSLYDGNSPLGLIGLLGAILFAVWVVALSICLVLARGRDAAGEPVIEGIE